MRYKVGDTVFVKPANKVLTIVAIKDGFYDFGINEEGVRMIGDISREEDYELPGDEDKTYGYIGGEEKNGGVFMANQVLLDELTRRFRLVEKAKDQLIAGNYGIAKKLLYKILYDPLQIKVIEDKE